MMKTETAIKIISKEAEFLGMPFLETLIDIKKNGRMMYSEKVVEAFNIVFAQGQQMFAKGN